ncbi:hypothetical protein AB0M36_01375 [Actinoplanes sp. NPDC051346]|uniref:hypothetical protein n=1 Tax=Actinoplanes sp. NPDC051346 TaxID=3155048 RepID=UPI003428C5C2
MDADEETNPSRTLLEQLVRKRHWAHADFCREYAAAAKKIFGQPRNITPQTASRWLGGKLKGLPYPGQQRVLVAMFDVAASDLFGAPGTQARSVAGGPGEPDEEVAEAAAESARFMMTAEQTNVGPHTLDQFASDLRRIVTVYPNRPVYPLFVELRGLRSRAFELLEGQQYPDQTRDLYLIAGTLCGVLANASFDLGNLAAAETQARTAYLCAELAGHNGLRAWIRGTQSLVAYWDNRPREAVNLAVQGARYVPENGTALVRLASIEARARGQMRDRAGVDAALARARVVREATIGEDDFGGMMSFPQPKQDFYAATARLWLGDPGAIAQAEHDARNAVEAYESARPEDRRLGEENLARLDLAVALLYAPNEESTSRRLPDLDGAAIEVRAVLEVSARRPTDSVTRRLRQVGVTLNQPRYRGSQLANDLKAEITARTDQLSLPALPAGQCR